MTLWDKVDGVTLLARIHDRIGDLPNYDAPNGSPIYNSGTQQDARFIVEDLLRTFFE